MKIKFNVSDVLVPGLAKIGKVEFEFEGQVSEIKESIELLPLLMEQYKAVEGAIIQTPKEEVKTEQTVETKTQINMETLEALGLSKEALQKLFSKGGM